MRHLWHNGKAAAFSLVELLVVIAIIGLLAALLLPALNRGKARAQRVECIGDLQEIGTAFQMFAHDHRSRFPMQTPMAEGGSMEFVQAGESINGTFYFSYRHFQPLAGDLVQTKPLVCPADVGRGPAANFGLLQNSNLSYFVGVNSTYDQPLSILAGDRNITNDTRATASLVRGSYGLRWTSELHFFQGNILFADGHVQEMNNAKMDLPAGATDFANFFLPAVEVASTGSPTSPGSGGTSDGSPADGGGPSIADASPSSGISSNPPAPSSPMPTTMSGRTASSGIPSRDGSMAMNSDTQPRDKDAVAATNVAPVAGAPAAADEAEPPLVWLLGAARALMAKVSWWLLLVILLLLAMTLYLYAKRKMHERERRKGGI